MTEDELFKRLEDNYGPHDIVEMFGLTTSDLLYYCGEKVMDNLRMEDIIIIGED